MGLGLVWFGCGAEFELRGSVWLGLVWFSLVVGLSLSCWARFGLVVGLGLGWVW